MSPILHRRLPYYQFAVIMPVQYKGAIASFFVIIPSSVLYFFGFGVCRVGLVLEGLSVIFSLINSKGERASRSSLVKSFHSTRITSETSGTSADSTNEDSER